MKIELDVLSFCATSFLSTFYSTQQMWIKPSSMQYFMINNKSELLIPEKKSLNPDVLIRIRNMKL